MPRNFYLLILFLATTVLTPNTLCAQKKLKLVNLKTKKEILITTGTRVGYVLKEQPKLATGVLTAIETDAIDIEGKRINLADLNSIGKKRKGSGFGIFTMAVLGGSLIGAGVAPDPTPSCSGCTVIEEDNGGTEGDVILVVAGSTLIGLAINSGIKNAPKDVVNTWKLEVVD
jgi:hypothetical protein